MQTLLEAKTDNKKTGSEELGGIHLAGARLLLDLRAFVAWTKPCAPQPLEWRGDYTKRN